jgi:broad specificity phosphatase PhoE
MTMTFYFIRHAAHDNVGGFLAGRMEGIRLGPAGKAQAERLAHRMQREEINAIYSSPRERTRQTAAAIAQACDLDEPQTAEALDEIDFGTWSGQTFETLDADPAWRRWNSTRSLCRTPGGESMLDVQQRILSLVEMLLRRRGESKVALVSHADVIKAAVSHFLGLPIDAWPRFDIAPASITSIAAGDWGAKVITVNELVS